MQSGFRPRKVKLITVALVTRHGQNQQRPVVKKSQRLRGRCKKIATASRFRRCNSKSYNGQAV